MHGLGADGTSWTKWHDLFIAERRLNDRTSTRNYTTSAGVANMALQIRSSYLFQPDNQAIYFGHSMGGVAGRHIDVNNNGNFGGFVTFGSPLDGASIANSLASGQASGYISQGVDKVTRGPIRELGTVFYLIWDLAVLDVINNRIDRAVRNMFGDNQGVTDLAEGSTYLNSSIKNTQTSTPKIQIYGNEEGPVLWHLVSSAANEGSNYADDSKFVNWTSTAGDVYNGMMWVNIAQAASSGWWSFGIGAIYHSWVANGWAEGRDWFRYDSENGWNGLIGASTAASKQICYEIIVENPGCLNDYYTFGFIDDVSICYGPSLYCYTYYSPINGQSDGFIKAPSQTGYNSDWSNNATKIEALGVNHLEMLGNDKVAIIFRRIFDNEVGSPFFQTDKR